MHWDIKILLNGLLKRGHTSYKAFFFIPLQKGWPYEWRNIY
jgi:hypothetical protein